MSSNMSNSIAKFSKYLLNYANNEIFFDVRYDKSIISSNSKFPVVIICPGFLASKDLDPFPYIGSKIAEAGFISIVLNYSHNGVEGNDTKITNFEKFASNTVSKEIEDIAIIVNEVGNNRLTGFNIDENRIVLLGHSRGAANAIINASYDQRIRALVTWASISKYDRWNNHQKSMWKKIGYLPLGKSSEDSPLKLGLSYLIDIEQKKEYLNLIDAAKRIRIPWLIVHGVEDLVAKIYEAESLYEASNKATTEIIKINKVGHMLGMTVPFDKNKESINYLIDLTINWLKNHCK